MNKNRFNKVFSIIITFVVFIALEANDYKVFYSIILFVILLYGYKKLEIIIKRKNK